MVRRLSLARAIKYCGSIFGGTKIGCRGILSRRRNEFPASNRFAPGLVDTEMGRRLVKGAMGVEDIRTLDNTMPFGRVCSPEEVADVVRFLVSEAGSFITGQRIYLDGGAGY